MFVAKICNLCGVCAHTALAYCKKRKHQKPNSDYGLHKHFFFLALSIANGSMALGNTQSEWKHRVKTMLSFS